jgi:hypothetical protein
MKNVIMVLVCVLFLFSCSSSKEGNVVLSNTITKYDMTLKGFNKNVVTGLVEELAKLPFYVKHNVLDLKDNTAILTYTIKGDGSSVGEITRDIENYLSKQGAPAEVNYASGMFKINRRG